MNRVAARFALAAALPAGLSMSGCRPWPGSGNVAGATLTFNRDIAPIVFEKCAPCHHAGGPAPFSLVRYEDVKSRVQQIVKVTARGYMPPWLPEPGDVPFVGERRLSAQDIASFRAWAAQGAARGNPAGMPAAPTYASGWQLGTPDLVLTMPEPYLLPARGSDVFRNIVFPVPINRVRYVRSVEILPSNGKVVHHANLVVDRSGSMRRADQADPDVGFGGMEVATEFDRFEPDSHFLFWKPGTAPHPGAPDMAWRLDPGTDLVLNLHLQPSGKPEPVQAAIGLYFSDDVPTRFPMLLQLEHDAALDIPPGAKDFTVTDELVLPVAVQVLGVYPHAHYLGKDLLGGADLPDGTHRTLIHIKDWNFAWQAVYEYARPLALPAGTRLWMRYSYDNSSDNPRNPADPPQRVVNGDRAIDEMAHLWVQVLPDRREDRGPLQEALMRQRLRKDPGDYTAHLNLASVLESTGKLDEASAEYRQALRARPGEPTGLNGLGTTLQARGDLDGAVACYRQALERRPDYLAARYNLANSLLALGQFAAAKRELVAVLRASPDDAAAHSDLATVLAREGNLAQAGVELERAVALAPGSVEAWWNLGNLRARQGRARDAVAPLQRAVALQPKDAELRNDLGSAFAALGRFEEAAAEFEEALRIDGGHAAARRNLNRARALLARKSAP